MGESETELQGEMQVESHPKSDFAVVTVEKALTKNLICPPKIMTKEEYKVLKKYI